jgi:glyoxylase-like metal-dependent hydrolase (beta-lactamase superfamily II)
VRTQGGYPVLNLAVSGVKSNTAEDIALPVEVTTGRPIEVVSTPLAAGVYYFTGGTHHSVVIEQTDHVVVVEAPQHEARSLAVIAKVKELIPNKPIKYLINTHAHFDHAGGLRTYVDEGATIVTHATNLPYYEQVWAAQRIINPDHLAQSKKTAVFETFSDKYVLTDGKRPIDIYPLVGSGHNDAFAFVYLPKEKILTEADAYTPAAADAPPATTVNPYSANLYDNIQKLKLDVDKIAALHGPRVATITDLRTAITPQGAK